MISSPQIESVLASLVDSRVAAIHKAMPGRVESFDASTQKAVIQPLIKRARIDEEGKRQADAIAPVVNVPIMFPGAGGYRITFPVNRGDIVLLIIADASLDHWLAHGGLVDPADDRRNDISDGIAIPGLYNFANLPTDTLQNSMVLHGEAIRLGSSNADDRVALMSDLLILKNALSTATISLGTGGAASVVAAANTAAGVSWPNCSQKVKAE